VVAEVEGVREAGLQRAIWNLRTRPEEGEEGSEAPGRRRPGPLVSPGRYPVTLELRSDGDSRILAGPVELHVVPLGRARYERVSGLQ